MPTFSPRRRAAGFNLIELMLVLAVIGVLAAIALPSYQSHVRKVRRAVVQADMAEYAQRAERFHSSNNSYSGYTLPTSVSPREGGTSFYALSLEKVSASAFTLVAQPQNGQEKDACGKLTLDQANRKTAEDTVSSCW
ncbi:type IV pilin protein [Stenotrophomonas sp. 24(2023)]|uniref:type IV pilin protein n=1 Tax=Stenotrophomonas sp. 24(2023) TaxID=3068324 RepID=UPI0027E1E35A|nr:type IV pilin protein [Stenotrophomonas sp. 24(2023)]WMJ68608.1 type IV pilin protein [Stenotrophomonas sp. 24(2023)]